MTGNETQQISYRELVEAQFSSVREKLDDLKNSLKEMNREVVKKDDFSSLKSDTYDRIKKVELQIELQTHALRESLDELEKIVREKQKSIRPEKIVEIVLAIIEAERQRQLDNHERKRKAAIAFEVVQRTGYKIGEFSVTATSEGKIKITAQFDPNDFDLIAAKLKDIKAEHNE